jgi:hypothetical protein
VPYYEVTFETGRSSVAFYEDDAQALSANGEQDRRARSGEPGGPLGAPAERVAKIRVYDAHPDDFNVEQTMSAEVATKELAALVKENKDKNNVVFLPVLAQQVQALSHPMVQTKENTFDSNFKMPEKKELKLNFGETA